MARIVSFVIFIFSILLYLSGIFPLPELGFLLPTFFFLVWALEVSWVAALVVGVSSGLFLGAYSLLRFGSEALVFIMLVFIIFAGRRYFIRRFLWGDWVLVFGGALVGEIAFFFLHKNVAANFATFILRLVVGGLTLGVFWWIIVGRRYKRSIKEGEAYVA